MGNDGSLGEYPASFSSLETPANILSSMKT
jgi:hypothetical protein